MLLQINTSDFTKPILAMLGVATDPPVGAEGDGGGDGGVRQALETQAGGPQPWSLA